MKKFSLMYGVKSETCGKFQRLLVYLDIVLWIPVDSKFMTAILCLLCGLGYSGTAWATIQAKDLEDASRPNVLIITADDMTYNSLGVMGNPMENITPNIDQLAKEGMLFTRGYVTTPVCGPSRESILTGLYPGNHGVMGHGNQPPEWWKSPHAELTGLFKWLRENGYYTGVIDKHLSRYSAESVDYTRNTVATGLGRDPVKYGELTLEFLKEANQAGKPFILNVNTVDPHRPWAGERDETEQWIQFMLDYYEVDKKELNIYPNGKPWPDPKMMYLPKEVVVPAPYPDTPDFREWLSHYYASVNRLDEVVGRMLDALGEDIAKNTIVIFLSDHGMPFTFSKWSLYPHGTRTPIIVRWPDRVEPGQLDATHLLSTVDIMPTLLDALDVPVPYELDGTSFFPLLTKKNAEWPRENAFTTWNFMDRGHHGDSLFSEHRKNLYQKAQQYRPMRALHGQRYTYVWNGWADGETKIPMVMGGERSPAISILSNLESAGPLYPDPSERVQFYLFRAPEELYNVERDPGCLNNLAEDPAYRPMLKRYQRDMLAILEANRDHELDNYRKHLGNISAKKGAGDN